MYAKGGIALSNYLWPSVTDKPVPVCRDLPWQSQTNCLAYLLPRTVYWWLLSSVSLTSQARTTSVPSMYERASIFKYAEFNKLALCRLASKLRGGQSCFCDTSQTPASGSFNWTILISFIDGVKWMLRSSRNDGGIKSDETNLILLASEAATLKYIKANSTIPVPEIFAYRQAISSILVVKKLTTT